MLKLLPSFYNSPYANYNPTNLMNEEQRNFLELNTSVNRDLYASGINGFASIKSLPMFNSPEDAKVISNGSAYLVLGPDNPYGPGTGKSKISNRADSIDVVVINDQTGETETITLTETGVDTGVFEGTVNTVFGDIAGTDNDGIFNTQAGDTVTVTYDDELDRSNKFAEGVVVNARGRKRITTERDFPPEM